MFKETTELIFDTIFTDYVGEGVFEGVTGYSLESYLYGKCYDDIFYIVYISREKVILALHWQFEGRNIDSSMLVQHDSS